MDICEGVASHEGTEMDKKSVRGSGRWRKQSGTREYSKNGVCLPVFFFQVTYECILCKRSESTETETKRVGKRFDEEKKWEELRKKQVAMLLSRSAICNVGGCALLVRREARKYPRAWKGLLYCWHFFESSSDINTASWIAEVNHATKKLFLLFDSPRSCIIFFTRLSLINVIPFTLSFPRKERGEIVNPTWQVCSLTLHTVASLTFHCSFSSKTCVFKLKTF